MIASASAERVNREVGRRFRASSYLFRNPLSEVGLDGLRTLERPRSTFVQDPGDGTGDDDLAGSLFSELAPLAR